MHERTCPPAHELLLEAQTPYQAVMRGLERTAHQSLLRALRDRAHAVAMRIGSKNFVKGRSYQPRH